MSLLTDFLQLLKKNPVTDGDDTFNVDTMLNENWDRIDKEIRKYHRIFTASNWTINNNAADGYKASITVSRAVHNLNPMTGVVTWRARSNVSGTYNPNTWAAFETIVDYNSSTGNITIKATSAYAGDILISG